MITYLYKKIKVLVMVFILIPLAALLYSGVWGVSSISDLILSLILFELITSVWFVSLGFLAYFTLFLVYKLIGLKDSVFSKIVYFVIESIIEISFFSVPFFSVPHTMNGIVIAKGIVSIVLFVNFLFLIVSIKRQVIIGIPNFKKSSVLKAVFISILAVGITYVFYSLGFDDRMHFFYYIVGSAIEYVFL